MVPKALFDELGGFDEHYLPAYCEDSDLALKIRDKGYRVIYQPLSTVIHFEGITSGTDTTQGTKAYQVENSKKLFARWNQRLAQHQAAGIDVDSAKDRMANRRVLVIDHCTPTPNQDAGSVTVFNTLLLLREMKFQVTFIPEDNFLYMPEYTTALQRAGIEVLYAPYVNTVEQHLKEHGQRYDLAFLFRPGVVERHLVAIRKLCPQAKVLFHTVDLHFLRMSREAELQSDYAKQKAADEMKRRELAAIRAVDSSIVHSTAELEILRSLLVDAKLHVFPLIMDIKGTSKSFDVRRDIIFVGGYQHAPNVDAVQFFAEKIMPLLRKQLPGVRFYVVGSKPPPQIQELASEDIIIVGFVEDLNTVLCKMRVSVAPLRYGAGIKGKIGTAMAVGLPVVATSLAAEGMSLTDGENVMVADGPEQFADAVVSLYQDETLWSRISHNGLEFAENAWGAEAAWKILSDIAVDLGMSNQRSERKLSLYSNDVVLATSRVAPSSENLDRKEYVSILGKKP
jgi:glycosyltransferase involved in cell wall biosynthesis